MMMMMMMMIIIIIIITIVVIIIIIITIVIVIVIIIIIILQLSVHPVAVDLTLGSKPYTDIDKEIKLYIKGTIQNKVYTMQIQTCTVTRSTHVARMNK
jgi:hypothetical protein